MATSLTFTAPQASSALRKSAQAPAGRGMLWRFKTHLIVLVLLCVLPMAAFAVSGIMQLTQAVRETARQQTWAGAQAISSAIDLRIRGAAAALNVLTLSPSLHRGDLESFYQRCRETARQHDASIILADLNGQELFSTSKPFGAALPQQIGEPQAAAIRAIATKDAQISNLFLGRLTGRSLISLTMPVMDGTAVIYTIDMAIPTQALTDILLQQNLPESWTVSVVDRNGMIIARNRSATTYVGSAWHGDVRTTATGSGGELLPEVTKEGTPVYAVTVASPTTGWSIVTSIPRSELDNPPWQSLRGVVTGGAGIACMGILIAALFGRRLAASMGLLSSAALALGQGRALPQVHSSVREVSDVALALDEASALLAQSEAQRRHTETHLARAQRIASIGSWEHERHTGRLTWSDETYRLFGLSPADFAETPMTSRQLLSYVHDHDRAEVEARVREFYAGAAPPAFDFRIVRTDGEVRHLRRIAEPIINSAGEMIGLIGTVQDMTDSAVVEERLRHAQKMEAIGALTGGMAHDFNNLLGIIIGNLDLLRPLLEQRTDKQELLQEALEASVRGADLIRRMLAFARRQPLLPERLNVNELVSDLAKLLGRTLGEHVAIDLNLSADVWPVLIDSSQLASAITNLATNARDAMPRGGRLTFATANTRIDETYIGTLLDLTPGDYAVITVSDTGTGMPPEVVRHIFEPFFTTKDVGQGSGLGLSMVFGFIKQSNGHIDVYSEQGRGTVFRVYLPRCETADDGQQRTAAEAVEPGGGEAILVVDDNEGMRHTVVRQLLELGYRVFEAADSDEALAFLAQERTIDLLFTDIVMPGGIDGFELAHRAVEGQPKLRVLLTSGFPDGFSSEKPLPLHSRLLGKPYRKAELARVLRQVLDD